MAKLLNVGDKIEFNRNSSKRSTQEKDSVTYVSQVLDLKYDDTVVAAMPISEGHIVPIEVGEKLEAYFYTTQGIYKSACVVTERGKEGNIYCCKLELTGKFEKFQRREYYRLPCTISADIMLIDGETVIDYSKQHRIPEKSYDNIQGGTIVDISGGGARIMSDIRLDKNGYIFLRFPLEMNIGVKVVELMGKVILSLESPNRSNYYDNRIQFREVTSEQRDNIIKYIFEQQRKIQKRERG